MIFFRAIKEIIQKNHRDTENTEKHGDDYSKTHK